MLVEEGHSARVLEFLNHLAEDKTVTTRVLDEELVVAPVLKSFVKEPTGSRASFGRLGILNVNELPLNEFVNRSRRLLPAKLEKNVPHTLVIFGREEVVINQLFNLIKRLPKEIVAFVELSGNIVALGVFDDEAKFVTFHYSLKPNFLSHGPDWVGASLACRACDPVCSKLYGATHEVGRLNPTAVVFSGFYKSNLTRIAKL